MKGKQQHPFYSINIVQLAEASDTSEIEILRVGTIQDRGLKITMKMLEDMVKNFKEKVYGVDLQVNKSHFREGEATGWFQELRVVGDKLMAKIEWNPLGKELLQNKIFKYVSAEFSDIKHHLTGKVVENVLIGLALTNVPALKGQSPIVLSETIQLSNLNETMFKKFITNLSARKYVTKEDKTLLREMFTELSEEDQAAEKAAVESVEAKPEVDEAKAKEEADAKAAAEKEAADKAAAEGSATTEQLSEKLAETNKLAETQAAEIKALNEKLERTELSEQFEKTMMLSTEKKIGFTAKSKDKVVAFMAGLLPEKRAEFATILSEVISADIETKGSTAALGKDATDTTESDTKLAEARSKETGKPLHISLSEIYAERAQKESK